MHICVFKNKQIDIEFRDMDRFSGRYYNDKIIDVYSQYLTTQHKLSSGLKVPTIAQNSVLLLSALVFTRALAGGDFGRLVYAGFDQIRPLIRLRAAFGV